MTKIKLLLFALSIIVISACDYNGGLNVTGRYYLTEDERKHIQFLSYRFPSNHSRIGLIEGPFSRITYNKDYILVEKTSSSGALFYIVPVNLMDSFPENEVVGPLTENEYQRKIVMLNINIENLHTFKNLK